MVRLAGHGAEHGHPGYLPFWGIFGGNKVAHFPGCGASRPIRGECLVNANLVFERGAIYATTFLQRSKIGKVIVSPFISKVYTL